MRIEAISNNNHLKNVTEYFGPDFQRSCRQNENVIYVFICFTNRCGSNYLAELIGSSGLFNVAGEDLNWDTVINNSRLHSLRSFSEYFMWLTERKKSNGYFFLKTAPSQLEVLNSAGVLDQIADRTKFIVIERSDKLAQAISYALAFATGRYTSYMEGSADPDEVGYSQDLIDKILRSIAETNKQFDVFFGSNGIVPVNVTYEQVTSAPDVFLDFISRSVGLPAFKVDKSKLRLERQSNDVNVRWKRNYLAGT